MTTAKTAALTRKPALEQRITNLINSLEDHWISLEEKGLSCARIWAKVLSKPVMTSDGEFAIDENGKVLREAIASKDGEAIDDSCYILSCTDDQAKEMNAIAGVLSGTGCYVSMELYLNDELKTFNLLKASFNETRQTWEIITAQKRISGGLCFSQIRQMHADEMPINI